MRHGQTEYQEGGETRHETVADEGVKILAGVDVEKGAWPSARKMPAQSTTRIEARRLTLMSNSWSLRPTGVSGAILAAVPKPNEDRVEGKCVEEAQ
jgi:hypothetical protein